MAVSSVRPDVADLVLEVFERSVHPELLTIHAQAEWQHSACTVKVQLCDAGHVLTVAHQESVITEVATIRATLLPKHYRIFSHKLKGHRQDSLRCRDDITYHVSFDLDELEPEVFANYHEELLADSLRSPVAYHFATKTRLNPTPLSFVQLEATADSLQVHTFHTFPDNFAVVKVQSRFEFQPVRKMI